MASLCDSWIREQNETLKLSEEIDGMILERSSLAETSSYALRHASSMRRKITILATRVQTLKYLLAESQGKSISGKEMSRRKGTFENLRSKANQMASALDMLKFSNIDILLRPEKDDIMSRVIGLDNQGIVGLHRQVMKEHDEALDMLEETVMRVKHNALVMNEQIGLQTRLIDGLDHHVDVSDSGVRVIHIRA
ncbi:unnamed protein product [Arabidopsis thaliana]|uniref:Target SNARE coiled-coil domain protein n=4 Tax=Arabidopsis TaxID=3701 RepID=F4I2U8_ARATH|nr:Target SNARE coiled-coil domain protein [Arabidopsis thaliana]AEE29422.1 Target SNARE coiled-coil domain protein [Arabidopsis thaliana]KAG7646501.1 Target SNARE coiled-coil homology domain [Arabidopsis thaliana x Arabidopsis arenosa]KAG7654482.1 Target SNARE coiled-coil homology domain [Arabidopsis suecica]VYS46254.1 unnamed protein product [Arabidopsis thaliana]|eukprot:NP_001319019.1 Target SNARE coiled-coil domain protein [Arabidopsis thaliana]